MLRSKLMIGVIGLAFLLAPMQISNGAMVSGVMRADIQQTRTNEENEEVEFVSTVSEMSKEVVVEEKEYIEVKAELTFYTDLAVCNGSNVGKNAIGGYLSKTSIAIPRKSMPFGTKIDLGEYGIRYADDVGSSKYIRIKDDGTYIFDVFIPRNKGESDKQYKARIMDMGRVKTTAKIYIKE